MAVVTNISYDHTEVLGPTLEDIARDKAGIFNPGCTGWWGRPTRPWSPCSGRRPTRVGGQEFWVRGIEFACTSNRLAVGGRLVDLRTPGAAYGELLVPLHGSHQGDNAACALAAVEAFFGDPLHEDVVEEGFASVRVPGRLEVIGRHPLVLVDGAHNAAGMMVLARSLNEEFATDGGDHRGGRHADAVGTRRPCSRPWCRPGCASVVACAPGQSPGASGRAGGRGGLRPRAWRWPWPARPTEAVRLAVERSDPEDQVVVCGSLYVVADAREAMLHP